jgi:hypothetical protein
MKKKEMKKKEKEKKKRRESTSRPVHVAWREHNAPRDRLLRAPLREHASA